MGPLVPSEIALVLGIEIGVLQKGVATHANEQKTGPGSVNVRPFLLKLSLFFPFPVEPVPKCNIHRDGYERIIQPFGVKDIARMNRAKSRSSIIFKQKQQNLNE